MSVQSVTDETFEQEIVKGKVFVKFWATWCGPCKMMAPIVEEVAQELTDVKVIEVDIDDSPITREQYGIMSVPSFLLFQDGELQARTAGYWPKADLIDFINQR